MLFLGPEDFFEKVRHIPPISRELELHYAKQMALGDTGAREALITGYLPYVAAVLRRGYRICTLELILRSYMALEKAVDSFDFLQDREPFSHRLSWVMRQTVTAYIADRGIPSVAVKYKC